MYPRGEKAIVPTGTGQIGINPVESDLGQIFGADTQYIVEISDTTEWLPTYTSYLSVTTINPTNTSTIQALVATATAAGNVSEAAKACNVATVKRIRRGHRLSRRQAANDVLEFLLQSAAKDTADGALFDQFLGATTWEELGTALSNTANDVLTQALAAMTTAQARKTMLWLAAAAISVEAISLGTWAAKDVVGKYNFPKEGFAPSIPPAPQTTPGSLPPSSRASSTGCASTATKGPNSDPNKNCRCLDLIPVPDDPYYFNSTFMNFQQELLSSISLMPNITIAPSTTTAITNCSFQTNSYNKAPQGSSIIMTSAICDNKTPVPSRFTRVSVSAGAPVATTMSTTCSIVTNSYPKTLANSTTLVSGIVCQCAFGDQLAPSYAASGTSTTSWCGSTIAVPAGFTKLSESNGSPIPLPTTSSTTSSANTASPSPNKEVILIWSYPPKTGEVTYDTYLVALGYNHNLDTKCTEVTGLDNSIIPLLQNVPDPNYIGTTTIKEKTVTTITHVESVPGSRPTGGVERRAPGSLEKFEEYDCTYEEPKLFTGSVVCGDKVWKCHIPNADEEESITPNYGACDDIKVVRPLVMICPVNLVKA
ncbi:hypothetical protein BCON_0297g00130 [Botryotinia convoluta]|uniref:Uncharacterized protein n=1 Tax=Botryotinia convoluta TaxID=54673 RepID=A0A4Z1HCX1_9HELO|nr:hypothetical protein BCON_0297g00130 [Botryotinia convoluta]